MARGRSKKVGLTRMDAAIDALTPLGFSKTLISRTVKALLKVYDDDSGWIFIEEASYKLLIDAILEEQENEAATKGDEQEVHDAAESSAAAELPNTEHEEGEIVHASEAVPEVGEVVPDAPGIVPAVLGDEPNEDTDKTDILCLEREKRKPCYGWITSGFSDDDEDVFVILDAVASLKSPVKEIKRERKRRWDVKPGEL